MANDLNQCNFIGRLGKEPEVRYLTNGEAVASFSIAVGSSWKDKSGEKQERTEWVNITAWGKLAEICGEYLKKGQQVFVTGHLKTDKYTDRETGKDRYTTKIVAETIQMLGGKPEQGDKPAHSPAASQSAAPRPAAAAKSNFDNFDDDIPF